VILAEDARFLRCLIVLLNTALFGACDNINKTVNKNVTRNSEKKKKKKKKKRKKKAKNLRRRKKEKINKKEGGTATLNRSILR